MRKTSFQYFLILFSFFFTPFWRLSTTEVVLFYQVVLTNGKKQLLLTLPNELVFFYKLLLVGRIFGLFFLQVLNHVQYFVKHWFYDLWGALKTLVVVPSLKKNLIIASSHLFFHSLFIGFGIWTGQVLTHVGYYLKKVYYWVWFSSLVLYFYFPQHLVVSVVLLSNIKLLRIKQKRLSYSFFYTVDEIWFFQKLLGGFLMNLVTIRLQDMNIPEVVEISYPLSWSPKNRLVDGVYQSDDFFFWAAHKHVDTYLGTRINDHLRIPKYLVHNKPSSTQHLETLVSWINTLKGQRNETRVLENVVDEIYYVFHDHFRLTLLEELSRDPLALIRLNQLNLSQLSSKGLLERYLIDETLLNRICKHWEIVNIDGISLLYINSDSKVPFQAEYALTSRLSLKQKFELFTENNEMWTLWDDYKFYWWYTSGEVLLQYYYLTMPMAHIFHGFPYSCWLNQVPEYALPSTAFQNIMLIPCILVFGITTAIYLKVAVTPMVEDFMTYPQWYWDFRRKFYTLFALDPMDFLGNVFYYRLVTWILIPPYLDWLYMPSGYRRRRLFLNCDLDFTRYIKKISRHRIGLNPFDTSLTDYFTTRFEQELSPLLPLLSMEQMKTLNNRRFRQQKLGATDIPITIFDFEPNALYYPRIIRVRIDTIMMNGLVYLEQDWLTSYVEHFESVLGNTELFDAWVDGTHTNHLVDYYNFLNFPIYYPERDHKKTLLEQNITEWYNQIRYVWRAGNWRRGEVPNVARGTIPINASIVAHQYQVKQRLNKTLDELLHNRAKARKPKRFIKPFFAHLLSGGTYYSKEDLLLLEIKKVTKKLPLIIDNLHKYLDFSFEDNFDYPYMFREKETLKILKRVALNEMYNNQYYQFDDDRLYQDQDGGAMPYADRDALIDGPRKLRKGVAIRYGINEVRRKVWQQRYEFRKRDVIVPTLFAAPILDPGVKSIFRNPRQLVRTNLSADYRTGFADVNLTFFSENIISGENYDYLQPFYQPAFLDFNNKIYKGPLVKPYDPVVFMEQEGNILVRSNWTKMLFYRLGMLTTLGKILKFLLRRYMNKQFMKLITIPKGTKYKKYLRSSYLDDYAMDKIQLYNIYGPRSEYHRISVLLDNADWERMYAKYLNLRYGTLSILEESPNVKKIPLLESDIENWRWRHRELNQIDIEQVIQTSIRNFTSDLVAKALNYDLLMLSRPEQSFFDGFYRTEVTTALQDWYHLDTAYFKRSTLDLTGLKDIYGHYNSSPTYYPSLFPYRRQPVNVIRQADIFSVTRAGFASPRVQYTPYLRDQYQNWTIGSPLNRELLRAFFAGGYASIRQLPHLPINDKHFSLDYWETLTRYKQRIRDNAFKTKYGLPKSVQVSDQLALSQAKIPGVADTNEIMQFYHRGLTKQYGIASAYQKFLNDWQNNKMENGSRSWFTAAFWYRLPSGLTDYLKTDQDRIRFFKNKNLSFPAEQFSRVRTMQAYQHYTRHVPNITGDIATISRNQKFPYWRNYYNYYLRRFNYFYRFMRPTRESTTFVQALHKKYGKRLHKPFHMTPIFVNAADAIHSLTSPEEQLNILLGLLNQHQNPNVDKSLMFDYVYNDLRFLQYLEPELTTKAIDSELSLPGSIVSPVELRDYWAGVQRYKRFMEEQKDLLNTLGLIYKQDYSELKVFPVMGAAKAANFIRLMNRLSFFNLPEFNPWEGIIDSVSITTNELKMLGLFLSGSLAPQNFFTREEYPQEFWHHKLFTREDRPVVPPTIVRPQHIQPLSHWQVYLSKTKIKSKTLSEIFRDDLDALLNKSYVYPFLRKFFNIHKVDNTSLGILRTLGFILEDDQTGLEAQAQQGLNHQSRRSQPHTKYLPSIFQQRIERYASLISKHREHLETNVLPPIVYAETPESFIDINMRKLEFEKERKYVAKRMKVYNDKIFKPLDYLRYPRLKERHRQREYFWYCQHFVNNWSYVNFDPKDVALIGHQILIPEIKTRDDSVMQLVPNFSHYPNPVGLKNYMTTYPYPTIEMCLMFFNVAEEKRVSEETVLRAEVDYIKKEYAGKYYKEIREELLEPLLEQLDRIEYERQSQLGLPMWPNSGKPGLWRCEAVDDIELIFDTQDEIVQLKNFDQETFSRFANKKKIVYPLDTVRHSDYRNYQLAAFGTYKYSSTINRMRYSEFRLDEEDETRFPETKRLGGRRADLNLLYLQRKNNEEIIRFLGKDENMDPSLIDSYMHRMNCYRDSVGSRFFEYNRVRDLKTNHANFWGVNFVINWDALTGFIFATDTDMRGLHTVLEVFTQPTYYQGWTYRTRQPLPRYKDQLLLNGYYNITQGFSSNERLLTQLTSAVTPVDLYGTFSENSLGLRPSEWFDIYDPVSERVISITPNSHFVFKNNLFLKRYTGFYRSTHNSENFLRPQGLVENLEHLASGFVSMESQVGRELAMTQLLVKNFGILPYQIIEFLTFATVWGQNWLLAIYNGSFVESHYKEWSLMNVTDGLLDINESNTKKGEARFRATYYKVLNAKIYNDQHLSRFLTEQERIVTEAHWREFLEATEKPKSVKVL